MRFGTVPLGHLGGTGLDLTLASIAPNDQPDAGGGSVAERHGGPGFTPNRARATPVKMAPPTWFSRAAS
jgi:hypothetical protein